MEINKIYQGDTLEVLKQMPDDFMNCIVTSPPYWALRDYGVDKQLGLEPTFQEYIKRLCDIFDEAKRVLKNDGTCFVNMGDTYAGGNGWSGVPDDWKSVSAGSKQPRFDSPTKQLKNISKCLLQIPSRFAIEMTNRGWILRNEIIWHKPNCMPSSAKDRFTVDFEKVFFFVKNKKYWFETQFEQQQEESHLRVLRGVSDKHKNLKVPGQTTHGMHKQRAKGEGEYLWNPLGRNKRCVWKVTTKSFKEAHFATFPEKLITPMIKAGCPEGGLVLDPFMGAGTTALVSRKLGRNYIGIELNPEYIKIAEKRLRQEYFNF